MTATFTSINPATGQKIQDYPGHSDTQIAGRIEAAHAAWQSWRSTALAERSRLMLQAAAVLRAEKSRYAKLMTEEMGKRLRDGKAEIEKCAVTCEYYAEHARAFLTDEPVKTEAKNSFVTFQPIGVILAVMPWNFPFWQVLRFAAPALMAGNVALLKHASNVPGCALALEEVFAKAGFPAGCFTTLLVGSKQVEAIIAHPFVRAVTLTGSSAAGSSVAQAAGKHLKKCVLELGGNDPYIILEDADIEASAATCVASRLINAGQSCIAAKRFIVTEKIYDAWLDTFTNLMKNKTFGDPAAAYTDLGPMTSVKLRDELHAQVTASIQKGARCVLGGEIPAGAGAFYPPTVLADVTPGMKAFDEELFGPVAAIIKAKDERHAIELANNSQYGLGGAIFSRNLTHATELARTGVESGAVFVNAFVKSDPRMPFGGIKNSGYGRELSTYGIREFVNIKSVWVG